MKKIILSLLLVTISSFAFAKKNEAKTISILKNKIAVSKQYFTTNKITINKKSFQKLLRDKALTCYLQGYAWASTFDLDCADGGTSTYVVSGIAWQLFCPDLGVYTTFCTDVESELSTDC